jgi:archaellum component FlaC
MKNLKGSLSLLKAKQAELKSDIKELTKSVDNATSMKDAHPYIVIRLRAKQQLAAIPGEIARVEKEVKRLNESYSNKKPSDKQVTIYSKGKK